MNIRSKRLPSDWLILAVVLAICLIARVAALAWFWPSLADDRDVYLALAQGIADGRGFSVPGTDVPTAYRPPLYPLCLVPLLGPFQQPALAILHSLLAAATCALILKTARNLNLGTPAAFLAALLFALDPLSIRYVAWPMTEVFSAFLVALLMFQLSRPSGRRSWSHSGLAGVTFGLLTLSRPTFWAFGALYGAARLLQRPRLHWGQVAGCVLGIVVIVAPWTLRNWQTLGSPIVMTTHGGYTLFLGNNEAFYREVVDQPWGTVWDGSKGPGQAAWANEINAAMDHAGLTTEVQRDRWMSHSARRVIADHPATFLRACLLKFLWFWNIVPQSPSAADLPAVAVWGTGAFTVLFWTLLAAGLVCLGRTALRNALTSRRDGSPASHQRSVARWLAPVLMIVSTSAVHLVYWSDTRMRAPIVPAIALVAVAWMSKSRLSTADSAEKSTHP